MNVEESAKLELRTTNPNELTAEQRA